MKVFLSIGNEELEAKIANIEGIEIVDQESDLKTCSDLIEFLDIRYLIVNRLLDDDEGKDLIELSKVARTKSIKIILLVHELASFKEKRLITTLVNLGVYAYIKISDFNQEQSELLRCLNEYPAEFDFDLLVEDVQSKKADNTQSKKVDKTIKNEDDVSKTKESTTKNRVVKEIKVEVIDSNVISVISSGSTGASFISYVAALSFAERDYKTVLIEMDNSSIGNYVLDSEYKKLMEEGVQHGFIDEILDNNYQKNLTVVTNENECVNLTEIIDIARIKKEITIIDCKKDNIFEAVKHSNKILLVFDNDPIHFKHSVDMINRIEGRYNPSKVVVVINNAFPESSSYKYIKEKLLKSKFKNLITIRNCGAIPGDAAISDLNPFIDKELKKDVEALMQCLRSRKLNDNILKQSLSFIDRQIDILFYGAIRLFKLVYGKKSLIFLFVVIFILYKLHKAKFF